MSEYIERETLLKKLGERLKKHEYDECTELTIYEDMHEVKEVPAADVAPVRYARWLKIEEHMALSNTTYFPMTITSETCSDCNVRFGFVGRKSYIKDNRCPNCGAKMMEGLSDDRLLLCGWFRPA